MKVILTGFYCQFAGCQYYNVMAFIKITMIIVGGPLFVFSAIAYIYVKFTMRPESDHNLDDCYYEFEDAHQGLNRYEKWSRITYTAAVIGALLLFVGMIL